MDDNCQNCEDPCEKCGGEDLIIEKSKNNFLYKNNLTCPHCGYIINESWEFQICDGELQCGGCNKNFKYIRVMSYKTEKLC